MPPFDARVETALASFRARSVDLGADVTAIGRSFRDQVIAQLQGFSGSARFPIVLTNESFGAGSFGRRTASQPLDDIDIYVVLDAGNASFLNEPSRYLVGRSVGPLEQDWSLTAQGLISSELVLARVAAALPQLTLGGRRPEASGINAKGKSAYLRFGQLNIDVSPVLWARTQGEIDRYYMPLGAGSPLWKPTNPKEDQRRVTEQNQRKHELVLPTVRLLKWWNENMNAKRLKGIHLEVMAQQAMEKFEFDYVSQAVHVCLVGLSNAVAGGCLDPTGLGPELDRTLQWKDRLDSYTSLVRAWGATDRAGHHSLAGNSALALAEWRRVFPPLT